MKAPKSTEVVEVTREQQAINLMESTLSFLNRLIGECQLGGLLVGLPSKGEVAQRCKWTMKAIERAGKELKRLGGPNDKPTG